MAPFSFLWSVTVVLVLVICHCRHQASAQCLPAEQRVDCHPDPNPSESACTARGCQWCPAEAPAPSCITPSSYGYNMDSLLPDDNGYRVLLSRASVDSSYFGDDFDLLTASFTYESDYRLHIRIAPETEPGSPSRYEVPIQIHAPATGPTPNALYSVDFINSPVFGFQVRRRSSGTIIFDAASLGGFTFADQFIQLAIKLPSENVYGVGENEQNSFRHNFSSYQSYGIWTRDQAPNGANNLYGAQPHYTVLENDGNSHSVVFINSNAQEFASHPAPALVYRTIGGILDIYIFLGPTPEDTVAHYTEAIGRMPIPHYWALGFHLCRFGYQNIDTMRAMVDRNAAAGIPQDVQYADLDNLRGYLSFTYDPVNFAGLPEYVRELHDKGIRFIISTEAYISSVEPNYRPLEAGNEADVWIKRPDGSNLIAGITFFSSVPVHYPDFTKNSTASWWTEMVTEFHDIIEYDGLWLDMNEPHNVANLNCDQGNKYNRPPYVPAISDRDLSSATLCPDSVHSTGLHYDLHSTYAVKEAEISMHAVRAATGKRGFNLCRSNYLGIGQWAAHWLGDNFSNWANMKHSIIGVLQYNQFGVPMVGPDICGYYNVPSEELCTRWLQLGAFYPFSRSHNSAGVPSQDPAFWGPESIASTRTALNIRYTLLPYLYTLFYYHVKNGGTVARALWHNFPTDPTTYRIDEQFMWGNGLLISPVLQEGATSTLAYFPNSRWYNYYNGSEVFGAGTYQTLAAPFNYINLHIHGGIVLPTQEPARNTALARQNPYGLVAALDEEDQASGGLYLDDGDSIDPEKNGAYFEVEFEVSNSQLTSRIVHEGFSVIGKELDTIRLMGGPIPVSVVIVNGLFHGDFVQDVETGELMIRNMNVPLGATLTVSWL